MALNVWGWEMPIEPLQKRKFAVKSRYQRAARSTSARTTTSKVGFQANKPQSLAECADLREALRMKKQVDNYKVDTHIAKTGSELTRVIGPASNVMIVSRAARGYFNERLRNLQVFLEVQGDQFGPHKDEEPRYL